MMPTLGDRLGRWLCRLGLHRWKPWESIVRTRPSLGEVTTCSRRYCFEMRRRPFPGW